jgi:hypothetical protein
VGVEELRMLEFERKAEPAIGLILGHEIRAVMRSVLDVYFFFLSNLHKVNGRTQPIRRNGKLCS